MRGFYNGIYLFRKPSPLFCMEGDDPPKRPECHVVSLEVHEGNIVVLTVRVNNKWIYSEANPDWIKDDALKSTYLELAKNSSKQREAAENGEKPQTPEQDDEAWQEDRVTHAGKSEDLDHGRDSGYSSDKSDHHDDSKAAAGGDASEEADNHCVSTTGGADAEEALRDFLLASLNQPLQDASTEVAQQSPLTLSKWYNTSLLFYTLGASKGAKDLLRPIRRDDLDEAKYIKKTLTPHIALPKYLRNMSKIPWYNPDDVEVLSESDDIHLSIHPTVVRTIAFSVVNGNEKSDGRSFLKLATQGDEHSIKRELKFLHLLQKDDLYAKGIRAPRLEGLISVPSSPKSRAQILGFLLTLIPQPAKPLTDYMDSSVSASKRNTWAMEAQRMVKILHDNGLVWGDAKADNFMVDGEGLLWMIDFGGSYTPGWIDEDLADTEDGDNMGTQKIVNAMRDPEANVQKDDEAANTKPGIALDSKVHGKDGPIASQNEGITADESVTQARKRSREDADDEDGEDVRVKKIKATQA